jgi:hypothetical protein
MKSATRSVVTCGENMSEPTPDDMARDLVADLARAEDSYGPNWGRSPTEATENWAAWAEPVLVAALHRALAAEALLRRLVVAHDDGVGDVFAIVTDARKHLDC